MDFGHEYKRHYNTICGFCFRMLGKMEIAQDITQETFTKLYELSLKGHQPEKLLPWLYKVSGNLCLNHQKRKKIFREKIESQQIRDVEYNNPEKIYIKNEAGKQIRYIVDQLPGKQKMLILMYEDGFSYGELAKATGMELNSVGKTLWRTIKFIADKMKENENQ